MSTAFSVSDVSPATALRLALRASLCLEEIAAIKAVPRWQLDAEDSLSSELAGILRFVAEQMIEELLISERIPGDELAIKILLHYLDDASGEIAEVINTATQGAAQHGRDKVVSNLRTTGTSGIRFDQFPEHTRDLIREHAFQASERTMQRIAGDVMANLTQSYEDGVGIEEAARRLREVFDGMEEHELKRVSRTEIISAQNEGAYLTQQELGVEYHEWISANDDRTRESHLEMHGQIVRVGEPFSNGLLFPGDFDNATDLSEVINCRCRTASFLMPEGMTAPPEPWFYESDLIEIARAA